MAVVRGSKAVLEEGTRTPSRRRLDIVPYRFQMRDREGEGERGRGRVGDSMRSTLTLNPPSFTSSNWQLLCVFSPELMGEQNVSRNIRTCYRKHSHRKSSHGFPHVIKY